MNPNDQGPSPDSVARLAVRLLATGEELTSDPRRVSAAVTTARQLLNEAGRQPKMHACDLFSHEAMMTYDDIAETFAENGWESLGSGNSVAKRVNEILVELHRDIGRRRDLMDASFRSIHLRMNPDELSIEAKRGLRDLVGGLGLADGFGETLDAVVSDAWSQLLGRWVKRTFTAVERLEATRLHTPEHFNAICVDTDYSAFSDAIVTMPELSADRFLNVILYVSETLRPVLKERPLRSDELERLAAANSWPERLFPDDPPLARPFAELLDYDAKGGADAKPRIEALERGLARFTWTFIGIKTKELAGILMRSDGRATRETVSEEVTQVADAVEDRSMAADDSHPSLPRQLIDLTSCFEALPRDQKEILAERFSEDPQILVRRLERLLTEGRYRDFGQSSLPWDGTGLKFMPFRRYAIRIVSIRRLIGEVGELSRCCGQGIAVEGLLQILDAEKKRLAIEDGELRLQGPHHSLKSRLKEGGQLLDSAPSQTKRWGRIRPHLLFAYARDKGMLEDVLFRRL